MQYAALLFLLLSMPHLFAMDMSILRDSAKVVRQAARNMSPEALALIRQSSSSVLPHLALAPIVQIAACRHAASMAQQQESKFTHIMLRGAKTGLYYSGKGLYYGGVAIIKTVRNMGKMVLTWVGASLISLVGLSVAVAAPIFVYKKLNNRLGNIETTQREIADTQVQHTATLGILTTGQQEQREQLNTIGRTQTDHTVSLGILTTGQRQLEETVDDMLQMVDNLTSDVGALDKNLNQFRQETNNALTAQSEQLSFLTSAFETASKKGEDDRASMIAAIELQKEELLVAINGILNNTALSDKEKSKRLDAIDKDLAKLNSNLLDLKKGGDELRKLTEHNQSELLAAIQGISLPASSSQTPTITFLSQPTARGRSPLPGSTQNHVHQSSQSSSAVLPKQSSFLDLPYGGTADLANMLQQSNSMIPASSRKSGSRLLGLTHTGTT